MVVKLTNRIVYTYFERTGYVIYCNSGNWYKLLALEKFLDTLDRNKIKILWTPLTK